MTVTASALVRDRKFYGYAAIGASGAALDFVVYALLATYAGWPPVLSTATGVSLGIVNNFFLNAWFNFRVRDHLLRRFGAFYVVGLVGVVLSMAIVGVATWALHLGPIAAKLLSILPVVLAQFLVNRRWAFGPMGRAVTDGAP